MTAKSLFGTMPDGRKVNNYTLFDEKGQSVVISEYGCRIVAINVFGNDGELHDVTLGYDTLGEYLNDKCYFGATIGRYANRIEGGKFTLKAAQFWKQSVDRSQFFCQIRRLGKRQHITEPGENLQAIALRVAQPHHIVDEFRVV